MEWEQQEENRGCIFSGLEGTAGSCGFAVEPLGIDVIGINEVHCQPSACCNLDTSWQWVLG